MCMAIFKTQFNSGDSDSTKRNQNGLPVSLKLATKVL